MASHSGPGVGKPRDNGPYRDCKGSLFEGGTRVCALANWPGRIKAQTVDGLIHAVDIYPTLAALAGASIAKCKPLDGLDVWETITAGKPSPRNELVYNIEVFRAGLRQGDWKLIWRARFLPQRNFSILQRTPPKRTTWPLLP